MCNVAIISNTTVRTLFNSSTGALSRTIDVLLPSLYFLSLCSTYKFINFPSLILSFFYLSCSSPSYCSCISLNSFLNLLLPSFIKPNELFYVLLAMAVNKSLRYFADRILFFKCHIHYEDWHLKEEFSFCDRRSK